MTQDELAKNKEPGERSLGVVHNDRDFNFEAMGRGNKEIRVDKGKRPMVDTKPSSPNCAICAKKGLRLQSCHAGSFCHSCCRMGHSVVHCWAQ
jgi:hypothetical protein